MTPITNWLRVGISDDVSSVPITPFKDEFVFVDKYANAAFLLIAVLEGIDEYSVDPDLFIKNSTATDLPLMLILFEDVPSLKLTIGWNVVVYGSNRLLSMNTVPSG